VDPRFKPGVDESGPKPYWGPVFCEKKRFSGERGMRTYQHKKAFALSKLFAVLFSVVFFIGGCGEPRPPEDRPPADMGVTIGSLVEVFSPDAVAVEGYGLVGGLGGRGSVECPPAIRAYLKRYIQQQLPEHKVDPDRFINSRNTAVVLLRGIMPMAVSKNEYFDVRVAAHPDTQTTSLEGGRLYRAELKRAWTLDMTTKALATVKGPVFIDTIDSSGSEQRTGYILGMGRVLDEYKVSLALLRPDFRVSALIRDKINQRFGDGTARARSASLIELKVPANYKEQKGRFISIVRATYVTDTPEIITKRIEKFVRRLGGSGDKEQSEIALEAIGNKCLTKLRTLLMSPNEEVRLREALEAITLAASRNDAAAISRRVLRDPDFDIRLAAYESLRKLDDISVMRTVVAGDFYLEQITQTRYKAVYVSRSGQPRIVLFGAPIRCGEDIFVESADGNVTLNARPGAKYVTVIRKMAQRPDIPPIQFKSSFELSDIIQTLCETAIVKEGFAVRPGLNVSYADAIYILKQMCEKGMVDAEFRAGPLPKID
jgi:hypothetical protein